MGSHVEINAILKLTNEDGMPENPEIGGRYSFTLKGERLFQFAPIWVTLVHNIGGKWKHLGWAHVVKQTIDAENHITSGEFVIVRLFSEEFSKLASIYESPDNQSYYSVDDL